MANVGDTVRLSDGREGIVTGTTRPLGPLAFLYGTTPDDEGIWVRIEGEDAGNDPSKVRPEGVEPRDFALLASEVEVVAVPSPQAA